MNIGCHVWKAAQDESRGFVQNSEGQLNSPNSGTNTPRIKNLDQSGP